MIAGDDAGTILDHDVFEGQVHGGVVQGAAQALWEGIAYDDDGSLLTPTLPSYGVPSAAQVPWIETVEMQSPAPANELGAKGIGESGAVGATPAVHNAVLDALADLGIEHLDLPLTPERVWRAIKEAT